ncbi:hypothetical protein [Mediterraneibacter sp.]|jgi:hypothetical protein|uniref:hypothetical protein n=1 Tax=Mediterraneibacter sp. TaxID=2316022 RepID=UPI00205EC7C5|nr:hypothetical protein [Mediterraneibacter sp.]DAZ05169.1 MAG TPA: hypothetical protein [Caudoviricetes sp.]
MIKDEKKRLPQYLDGLDNEELEKLRNDTSIENWRKNFILRFYEQLSLKELSKKDVCKNVSSDTDRYKLLFDDYKLAHSTLTECTNINAHKKLRTFSINHLIAISNSLNVSIDYLLGIETNESHENTDIHKVIGLNDIAINKLKRNKEIQRQLEFFLLSPKIEDISNAIYNEYWKHSLYIGVCNEYSNELVIKIKESYHEFSNKVFPLERNQDKYKQYLKEKISYKDILKAYENIKNFFKDNLSQSLQIQYADNTSGFSDMKLYDFFITDTVERTYDIFEHIFNDLSLEKITQSFLNLLDDFFNS